MPSKPVPFARALTAAVSVSLTALAFAASAAAVEPVDMGDAHDFSVLGNAVTSTGATAMSDDLGSTMPVSGTPIVLGQTHIGGAADAAKASVGLAYADAQLRPSTGPLPANLAGSSFGPGVYNASGAMGFTAGGVLTLTGDQDAVFIFQIGGALTIGASAQVTLEGGAQACNVFWQVNGATTVGASARLAGTLMADADLTVGAGSRIDGRLLSKGAVTLDSNAIRTACSETQLVAGPPGPAGADGADGAQGIQGEIGPRGATGATGATGADGIDGVDGVDGADGLQGVQGVVGAVGLAGADGIQGLQGVMGEVGLAGADGIQGLQGVMGEVGLTGADGIQGIQGAIGAPGPAGAGGADGIQGIQGESGARGATGASGVDGAAGVHGARGATGAAGPVGAAGVQGARGATGAAGPAGPAGPVGNAGEADTTRLCVSKRPGRRSVRQGRSVTWTIVVANCGARTATGVSVTDRPPRATWRRSGVGSARVRWNTGTLTPGAQKTYRITTRFKRHARLGRHINRATADADNAESTRARAATVVRAQR